MTVCGAHRSGRLNRLKSSLSDLQAGGGTVARDWERVSLNLVPWLCYGTYEGYGVQPRSQISEDSRISRSGVPRLTGRAGASERYYSADWSR